MDINYKCPCCEEQGEHWINLQQGNDLVYTEFSCENCDANLTMEVESTIEIVGLFQSEEN